MISFDLSNKKGCDPIPSDFKEHDASYIEASTCFDCIAECPSAPVVSTLAHTTGPILQNLQKAKKQARLRELRLRIPTVFGGSLLCFAGLGAGFFDGLGGWFYPWLICPGGVLGLLGLLPSDKRVVPLLCRFLILPGLLLTVVTVCLYLSKEVQDWHGGNCTWREKASPCWYVTAKIVGGGIFLIANALVFVRIASFMCLPSQILLPRLWWNLGALCLSWFAYLSLYAPVDVAAGHTGGALRNMLFAFPYLISGLIMVCGTDLRRRAQSWFMSRGEAAVTAAGVADLLGDQGAQHILAKARETFLYVPASKVRKEDMKDKTPNPDLQSLTSKGRLGFVDAFVSHSWHDDPAEKWEALQDWIQAFKAEKKREPLLWIDKYCIDQKNIEDNLQCLPVYIAGCQKLLVLCGATYLRRLWCIIEVFVFQQMGGDTSCLDIELLAGRYGRSSTRTSAVKQVNEQALQKLQEDVLSFDPRAAECFTEDDTIRLRLVVDQGGGGMKNLAQFIHDHFVAKVEAGTLEAPKATFS